jgi:hypothetical protein
MAQTESSIPTVAQPAPRTTRTAWPWAVALVSWWTLAAWTEAPYVATAFAYRVDPVIIHGDTFEKPVPDVCYGLSIAIWLVSVALASLTFRRMRWADCLAPPPAGAQPHLWLTVRAFRYVCARMAGWLRALDRRRHLRLMVPITVVSVVAATIVSVIPVAADNGIGNAFFGLWCIACAGLAFHDAVLYRRPRWVLVALWLAAAWWYCHMLLAVAVHVFGEAAFASGLPAGLVSFFAIWHIV